MAAGVKVAYQPRFRLTVAANTANAVTFETIGRWQLIVITASGGGNNFTRTIAASTAHGATLTRTLVLARPITPSVAHAATVARSVTVTRPLSTSTAHAAAIGRMVAFTRALAASTAHGAVIGRSLTLTRATASSAAHKAILTRAGAFLRPLTWAAAHLAALVGTRTPAPTLANVITLGADSTTVIQERADA